MPNKCRDANKTKYQNLSFQNAFVCSEEHSYTSGATYVLPVGDVSLRVEATTSAASWNSIQVTAISFYVLFCFLQW